MKKNIYRRRRICALLILLLILLSIKWVIFLLRDYRYAGRNKEFQKSHIVYEEGSPVVGEESIFLTSVLTECKKLINMNYELVTKYPFLNWDRVRETTISYCKCIEMSDGETLQDEITAKYYSTDNKIFVMEGNSVVYSEPYLKRVLIHELMHALTYSDFLSNNMLSEGVAEKFTEIICNQNHIPFAYSSDYTYNVWAYDMLENVFGDDKLIFMSYHGFLIDIMDIYTKKGLGSEFFYTLENLDNYQRNTKDSFFKRRKCEKMIKTPEDIIVHLTHNYVLDSKNNCDVDTVISDCKSLLISDDKYFVNKLDEREKEHK
ncbi:MAG: hypothetical protein K6B70_07465 [Clostridia bacterium]|nr:hypothetical protein [Clostridia bacterium]